MSLRNLDIKTSYAGKGGKILSDFLLPTIKEAIRYDRVTSFYTVDSLLAISQGIESLYQKSGKMRLIVGIHSMPTEFIDATVRKEYLSKQISAIRSDIQRSITTIEDKLQKQRLATIAWMIEDHFLEVKAASVPGEGIFHPKTLILADSDDNRIVAVGSPNETGSGLGGNFEQIMVAKSWESEEGVEIQEHFFEDLWTNAHDEAIVFDITKETADLIISSLGGEYKKPVHKAIQSLGTKGIIAASSKMLANFFVSGDIPALYMHQERAVIDALSRWPVRVLFADEVGLGKTFEVASTMTFMTKFCGIKRVVILTPKSVLKQWQDELYDNFHLNVWLYDSSSKTYIDAVGKIRYIGDANPVGSSAPDITLMSAQYARGNGNSGHIFSRNGAVLPDLIILDEAHSARVSKDISGSTKVTRMYKMLEDISLKVPHMILATATPMQKEASEYHSILKLLGLPKIWQKNRNYLTSLKAISNDEVPDMSDSNLIASLLCKTMDIMKPDINRLSGSEIDAVQGLYALKDSETTEICCFVQDNWAALRPAFIKLHPAHLLTLRNTRKSLAEVGYLFPKRNLNEVSIDNADAVQLFYDKVDHYLSNQCFAVENVLYPDRKNSIGFVRVSYMQRVASSLHSCKKSLERRYEKISDLKKAVEKSTYISYSALLDDFDSDDLGVHDYDDLSSISSNIDINDLRYAIAREITALGSLLNAASDLLNTSCDYKITESIRVANQCLDCGDKVLVFSRYADTVDALLTEFTKREYSYLRYGIYTGGKSVAVENGIETPVTKNEIKKELFTGKMRIVFCSDAASEGLNLQAARVLINVDVPWTPARLEQRIGRIARLGQTADEVDIYNVWYPYSIEAKMYHRIQKRLEESNLAIGEFPDIVADNIRQAVINGEPEDTTSLKLLLEIRNSEQTRALEKLWAPTGEGTESEKMRQGLMALCDKSFTSDAISLDGSIKNYQMPDGTIVPASAEAGRAESISLKSPMWDYVDYSHESIHVVGNLNGRPEGFEMEVDGNRLFLKHSSLPDIVLSNNIVKSDILSKYPTMLPNNTLLDLRYATECEIGDNPKFWTLNND